jgi:hypothetical protein
MDLPELNDRLPNHPVQAEYLPFILLMKKIGVFNE